MKLKFKNQAFQSDAVNAVVDLFAGQDKRQSTFSVDHEARINFLQNDFGIGNALLIDNSTLLANMHVVQKRGNLPLSTFIEPAEGKKGGASRSFCIEMETGTGKTYVYTKTIFELHKRYGFTKFIIVVPSVAIREGVYKSFQITREHFAQQYDNVPCRVFIYNSAKLSDVRQFATGANIEIMIINIDAFKKAENIINQVQDRLNGETAMRYIQDTNPVVIVDEPQSVDNTLKAKEAIESLNPLCVLRYSATHREKINLLYRLTPVDAYQMGLVKQICVSSNQIAGSHNKPYIKLLSVSMEGGFKAKIELDVKAKDGKVSRKTLTVKPNSDLFLLSGERELYDGYTVAGIDCSPGYECIEFGNTEVLQLGKSIGDIDENLIKRAQIRRTVETHLEKELRYHAQGIKVLSLFFIDEVKKYRGEAEIINNNAECRNGEYAEWFEDIYAELIQLPKFEKIRSLFHGDISAFCIDHSALTKVHGGYFSQDKRGSLKDTRGDTLDDYDTYNTIMREKEWLLSFDCPLRFIWSHSALREGWDNPNVFQVCTLIEQKSVFTARQKVGRGLRLCVNQDGERIEDKNINLLHVMAGESFAEFADTLQKEIEQETGVKFGVLQLGMFSGMAYTEEVEREHTIDKQEANELVSYWTTTGMLDKWMSDPEMLSAEAKITAQLESGRLLTPPSPVTEVIRQIKNGATPEQAAEAIEGIAVSVIEKVDRTVTYEEAAELIDHFEKKGYVTKSGQVKDTMKAAMQSGTLDLPQKFENARERFENIIKRADQKPPIRDASRDVVVRLNKKAMLSPEFTALWDKIKQKTVYRVQIDTEQLVTQCVHDLMEMPPIFKTRIISQTADIHIRREGVSHTERGTRTLDIQDDYDQLPNILTIVGEECLIKRETVGRILHESGRMRDFIRNPQLFMEQFIEIVKNNRHQLAIDGIRYIKLDGEEYYAQEIFGADELMANLDKNAIAVNRSVYDYVIYDSSTIERPFAIALDNDPDVKLFIKLPSKFVVETPIGTYNPDWAVFLDQDGVQKLYFVLETKGSVSMFDLRTTEQMKIHCGKQHFRALENGVELQVATDWKSVRMRV